MEIGEKIKGLRKKRDWSQQELALRIGSDQGQIGRYERGEKMPTIPTLKKIAKAFDVECGVFFNDTIEKKVNLPEDLKQAVENLVESVGMLTEIYQKYK